MKVQDIVWQLPPETQKGLPLRRSAITNEECIGVVKWILVMPVKEEFQTATGPKLECAKAHGFVPFAALAAELGVDNPH